MNALGKQFRDARIASGKTQEEIASAAGVSRKTLSEFEGGRTGIRLESLVRIVQAAGLEISFRPASPRPILDELSTLYPDTPNETPEPAVRVKKKRFR